MTSEGKAEASGYDFVYTKASVKVQSQGSRDPVISSNMLEGWEEDWVQGSITKEKTAETSQKENQCDRCVRRKT